MEAVGTVSKILLDTDNKQVFNLSCEDGSVRVVSNVDLKISKGDPIAVSGDALNDPAYGQQLQAKEISYIPISTPLLRGFLKTGSGIGDAIIDRLLAAHGSELIGVLETKNIPELIQVPRISEAIAHQLCNTWHMAAGKVGLIQLLDEKLSGKNKKTRTSIINSVMKAYRIYGEDTASKLEDDPYRLWAFATWRQTELLGKVMGVPENDSRRLVCAVEEALHHKLSEGHTVVHPNDFSDELSKLIGDELLVSAIVAANHASEQIPPRIVVRHCASKPKAKTDFSESLQNGSMHKELYHRMFSLPGVASMENYVENQLRERISQNLMSINVTEDDFDSFLHRQETVKHSLTDEQKEAVRMALSNPVSAVCGPAGTGKTSVLYCINDIVKNSGNSILQVALAGKAAQRLVQQTDENAYTIQSLLSKIRNQQKAYGTNFLDAHPLPVLHIDEASMVDLQTMFEVLKAFEGRPARFVFIGDPAQLPPIGIGLVFHQLIKSDLVPKVELTKNFRSTTDICLAANSVRAGIAPQASENVIIESYQGSDELNRKVKQHYIAYKDSGEVHVVAARKSTVSHINTLLHSLLTRPEDALSVAPQFCRGDSIIYKKNDASLGLVNGSTGTVVDQGINHTERGEVAALQCKFGDKVVMLEREQIQDDENGTYYLQHAYGITCHSAQGSEYGTVIVVLEKTRMLERSWLYTALTRAKTKVILLVEDDALEKAIEAGFKADHISVGLAL